MEMFKRLTVVSAKWQLVVGMAALLGACSDGQQYNALMTTSTAQQGTGYLPTQGFYCPVGGTVQINGFPYVMVVNDQGVCQRLSSVSMGQSIWVRVRGEFLNAGQQGFAGGFQQGGYGQSYFKVTSIDFNFNGFGMSSEGEEALPTESSEEAK